MNEKAQQPQQVIEIDPRLENPRYTIWRSRHPGAPMYEFMAWIASNARHFEKETGKLPQEFQDGFTAWLCVRYGAHQAVERFGDHA